MWREITCDLERQPGSRGFRPPGRSPTGETEQRGMGILMSHRREQGFTFEVRIQDNVAQRVIAWSCGDVSVRNGETLARACQVEQVDVVALAPRPRGQNRPAKLLGEGFLRALQRFFH